MFSIPGSDDVPAADTVLCLPAEAPFLVQIKYNFSLDYGLYRVISELYGRHLADESG